jgi:hypothetical protein
MELAEAFAITGVTPVNPWSAVSTLFNNYCARDPSGGYCLDRFVDNGLLYAKLSTDCAGRHSPHLSPFLTLAVVVMIY